MCWWIAKEALEAPLFWGSSSWARDRGRKVVSKHQTLTASSTSCLFLWQKKIVPVLSFSQQHILMFLVQLWNQEAEVFPSCAEALGCWWCSGEAGKEDSMWNFPPAEVAHPSKQPLRVPLHSLQPIVAMSHQPYRWPRALTDHIYLVFSWQWKDRRPMGLEMGSWHSLLWLISGNSGCGSPILIYAYQCLSYSLWIPSAADEENEAVLVCSLTGLFQISALIWEEGQCLILCLFSAYRSNLVYPQRCTLLYTGHAVSGRTHLSLMT